MTRSGSRTGLSLALVLTTSLLPGCGSDSPDGGDGTGVPEALVEPLEVAASSPLAAWLVVRIGGDGVRLSEAIPPDADHHSFAPSAGQIVELGEADLIVVQGASYEGWREGASLPESRVVDLSAGLDLIAVEGRTHSHGVEGEHSHSGVDPATWMDPALVLSQSQRLLVALEAASAGRAAGYLERGHALETELDRLTARVAELGDTLRAADVALGGQAARYAYLARALGAELLALEAEPDAHDLGHLLRAVGTRRLAVLWPSAPDEALRAKLPNTTTVSWVEVDPLDASGTSGYAYVERMNANLDRLEAALEFGDD